MRLRAGRVQSSAAAWPPWSCTGHFAGSKRDHHSGASDLRSNKGSMANAYANQPEKRQSDLAQHHGHRGRLCHRPWRGGSAHLDGTSPQCPVLEGIFLLLRCQPVDAGLALGAVDHSGTRDRRAWHGVAGTHLRARGQGPRCSRGDERGLLPGRPHPANGGGGQVARLGALHRQRRGGWA